ncbi:MAG: hypothetical protein ACPG4M_06920, partial [Alphaproteobacteria bacterium]
MPKTVPKPKLQPNGRWKLRITVPSDLRDLGFANGVREVIRTHPPSSKRVAMLWAQREFLSFESQVAAFKLKQSGEITPELREEYLKLARLGQIDEDAGLAADAPFDETLQTGVNPKTINRKLGAIKGYHGHLIERGLIDRRGPYGRPFDDLKTASKQAAKASTKNQTRPWTDEEVVQLYEAAKSGGTPQVVDMIVMGMFTGARIESLYRIRKRD